MLSAWRKKRFKQQVRNSRRLSQGTVPIGVSGVRGITLFLVLPLVLATGGCESGADRQATRKENATSDKARYNEYVKQPDGALTLEGTVSLALENSLERAIFEREEAIRTEIVRGSWYKMLPSLQTDFERTMRNTVKASNSVDLETGEESLATNFSSRRGTRTYGVSTMLNLLDFGISYFGAKQAANRVEIARYDFQRIRQNLALKASRAWWRCIIAEVAADEADSLLEEVVAHIALLDKRLAENMIKQDVGLKTQKQLLNIQRQLRGFRLESEAARADLAGLLGLRHNQGFTLAQPEIPEVTDYLKFDMPALEEEALNNRPELFQEDLEEKISRDNLKIAMLKLLPSPSIVLDHKWDMNPFLHANYWYNIGGKVAKDILETPLKYRQLKGAKLDRELIRLRRMSLAIGILSQLNLSVIDYHATANRALLTSEINQVQKELYDVTGKMVMAGSLGRESLITGRVYRFFAKVQHMQSYAKMELLVDQIRNTIGRRVDARDKPLPAQNLKGHHFDPDDIENLPTLALVAKRLEYSKYDISRRAKERLLASGEAGADAALDILNSVDERARVMAAIIVRENGSARVVAGLVPALADENPDVRYQAGVALREAFDQTFGYFHNGRIKDRKAAIGRWENYLFHGTQN